MIIQIAVEKNNAWINTDVSNFPFKLSFLDRTTGIIVEADLDIDAYEYLIKDIHAKTDVKKMLDR